MKEVKTNLYDVKARSPFPLINAVTMGLQEGRVFSEEDVFFVFHKAGFSYLAGKHKIDYPGLINFFLQPGLFPGYFHMYDAVAGLIAACGKDSGRVNIKVRKRVQLKFQGTQLAFQGALPTGYTLTKIDPHCFDNLSEFNLSLENKFWASREDFLANGFGFTVNNEAGLPVSICYSACVAGGAAEVDVATLPGYRGKGLAKRVVARFVQHCLENGITANWDCFEDNVGSLRTAESLGFKQIITYDFLSLFNKTGK